MAGGLALIENKLHFDPKPSVPRFPLLYANPLWEIDSI